MKYHGSFNSQDGELIKIKHMEDSHLLNSIRFMKRQKAISVPGWYYYGQLENLTNEAKKRGLDEEI